MLAASDDDPWLVRPERRRDAALRMFCFPYAGGSPNIFRSWARLLPERVEIAVLRLPGRDSRVRERPLADWAELLRQVEHALVPYLTDPFVFFGHSFGARIAFELTKRFEDTGLPLPQQLFISGCRCPHVPAAQPWMHTLPIDQFLECVRGMNGTPAEILANRQLMRILEPALRADMKLHHEFWAAEHRKTSVPIAAFSGGSDGIDPPASMTGWEGYTEGAFTFHSFAGDHFFLHTQEAELMFTLTRLIEDLLER